MEKKIFYKCRQCGVDVTHRTKGMKFCSQVCFWESRKGHISKKRNGKDVKCSTCSKVFYISLSRFGKKKFCSEKCSFDNQKKEEIKKTCRICKKDFIAVGLPRYQKQTCSEECRYALSRIIGKESMDRRKATVVKIKCRNCKKITNGNALYKTSFCDTNCFHEYEKKSRTGKNNPNYRGGIWAKNGLYKRGSKLLGEHQRACAKYKKNYLKTHDFYACEVCSVTQAYSFDTHHIRYASRHPKHPNLHNFRNLILVCRDCHLAFHGGRLKDVVERLEKERDLPGLFDC